METIYFEYHNPLTGMLQTKLQEQLSEARPDLLAEQEQFVHNVAAHFPDKGREWMLRQFVQACHNQNLAITEIHCPLLEGLLKEQAVPQGYFHRPGIIATYHYASYRILGKWLAAQGIPFRLLVAHEVMEEQGMIFRQALAGCLADPEDFDVLDAEDPMVLLKIRKAVREGCMVLAYIDGNVGSNRDTDHQRVHTCLVELIGRTISVRVGLGYIASWLQVPVYPIWSRRDDRGLGFLLHEPIVAVPGQNNSRQAVESVIREIYRQFSRSLENAPALWENWFFLDEFLLDKR